MIKFDCTGCGVCCIKTTPSLTLTEFLNLYQYMPCVVFFEFNKIDKNTINKGFKITNKDGVHYSILAQIITIPKLTGCHNLSKDNLCNIYQKRPAVCALYPINPGVTISNVGKHLEEEINRNKKYEQDQFCDGFDNTDNIIYREGKLINSDTEVLISKRLKEDKLSNTFLKKMFLELMNFDYISDEINHNQAKGEILGCTEDLLLFLKEENEITDDEFATILSTQKNLFNDLHLSFTHYQEGNDDFFDSVKNIIDYNLSQFE